MKKILVLTFVLLLVFSGMVEAKKKGLLVDLKLQEVKREPAPTEEVKVNAAKSFNDENISVTWTPKAKELKFELVNNSAESLEIIWEESTFASGKVKSKVIHAGIKPKNMKKEMAPTSVASKAKLKDFVYPKEYYFKKMKLEHGSTIGGGVQAARYQTYEWTKKPIFEPKVKEKKLKKENKDFNLETYKAELEKTTCDVQLVIKKGDKKYSYTFIFKHAVTEK